MGQSTSRAPHEPPPACPKKCYSSSSSSLCPVKKCSSSPSPYNVYSQPINSLNNIPQTTAANSLPNPNQTILLDTNRVQSTIPKGNTSTTWIYPSPQMFWNSLNRKGKIGDTKEAEMSVVVAIHNNMNESTWRKVREWERVVSLEAFSEDTHTPIDDVDPSSGPKLLKFLGRPTDLSPKAYLKSLLGHPLPFDRHDWTIQRPDSTTIRYVIDYYVDETKANEAEGSGMVKKNDYGAIKSIMVDVRPALVDSSASAIFTGVIGRGLLMPVAKLMGKSQFAPMSFAPSEQLKAQKVESERTWEGIVASAARDKEQAKMDASSSSSSASSLPLSASEKSTITANMNTSLKNCKKQQKLIDNCKTDSECAQAALGMAMCAGKIMCPLQRSAVLAMVKKGDEGGEGIDVAIANLIECVERGGGRRR